MARVHDERVLTHLAEGAIVPSNTGGGPSAYRIDQFLGQGGAGRAYIATVLATQEQVVLKFPKTWDSFYDITQEYRYLAGQRFPYVARMRGVDWCQLPGDPEAIYLVTDLYPSTLQRLLKARRSVPLGEATKLMRQMATGLQATGIVHRDLKPENIFLDANGNAMVGDFGLCIPANPIVRHQNQISIGGLMGTYIYMSPDQMLESPNIDVRSDIFALGLLYFEMLAGQTARPRRRRDQNEGEYLLDLLDWKIPLDRIADERARAVIATATENDPAKRYQDYWDILNDLDGIKS